MENAPEDLRTFDLNALRELAGSDFFDIVMERSPDIVIWRIAKAADHYNRARRLSGFDEEMGAIRLIAAEEELVVAIFKWLERNPGDYPDAGLMLRRVQGPSGQTRLLPCALSVHLGPWKTWLRAWRRMA